MIEINWGILYDLLYGGEEDMGDDEDYEVEIKCHG